MASTLKHLRSSTADKRPTASGLVDGQLAINTASGTPAVFFKDSNGGVVKVGPAHVGASAPNAVPAGSAGNSLGELWVDNSLTTAGLNYYTGSAFVNLTPSGTTTTVGLVELATPAETQTGTDAVRAVTPSGLQSKVSDSTSTTSSTTIASSTAVKSAYDLANAALPKAGGTLTGELLIGTTGSLVFEGSSDDSFETTIAVTNPTADHTITFPNVTGTVVTTGDSGTVTSTMIANNTIVNADINSAAAIAYSKLALSSGIINTDISASAAIVDTKLATISTADKVSLSALNIDGATDIGGPLEGADLFIVDDGAGGTNRKASAFRVSQLTYSGVTGDITIASGGTSAISTGVIVNADVNSSAAIDFSKLASLASANILLGNASNVATSTAVTGDVTISNAGVTAISSGVIVNADVNASAAIAGTKISPDFGSQTITTTGVVSAALGAAATPSITFTGDLNTGIYSPGADQVAVATNGTGRVFVDASGNVKLGAAAATGFKLAVDGDTWLGNQSGTEIGRLFNDAGVLCLRASSNVTGLGLATNSSSSHAIRITSAGLVGVGTSSPNYQLHVTTDFAVGASGFNQQLTFGNDTIQSLLLGTGYTALKLNPLGGNVGIGVTSPQASLGFGTSIDTTPTDVSKIQLYNSGGAIYGFGVSANQLNYRAGTAGDAHVWYSGFAERARIDTSGRLLVGTIASPAHQLQVSTDSAGKPSTNTWTIVSDERIKEDIELADLDLCYEAVKTIPLKRFKWKDEVYTEEQVRDRRKLGWIAQDVEAVFPKAVGTYEFKYNQVFEETIIPAVEEILDDEGNVTTPAQPERIEKGELISEDVIEDCRDLNSDQLYAAMYGAIQKLMIKVETLETELAALKAS